jgi:hypothetical protein
MSPMKILFTVFQQIRYELKMNKDRKIRLKILYGTVFCKPPVTKDFLIVSNPYPCLIFNITFNAY